MLLPVVDWKQLLEKRGVKAIIMCAAGVVLAASAGALGYYLWPEPAPKPPPPVATSTIGENADYVASDDFNRLPIEKRLGWVESQISKTLAMDDDEFARTWHSMDKEKRERILRNLDAVARARLKKQVREYSKLAPADRKAYLDERLDEFEKMDRKLRKAFGPPPGTPAPTTSSSEETRKRYARENADFKREASRFMVHESAEQRAKTVSFLAALGKRQGERKMGDIFGIRQSKR